MNQAQISCPATPAQIEPAIADLWREVLGLNGPIHSTDNFFALGGDSLTMMLFLFRAQEVFAVELPAATMLDAPELNCVCRALADALAQR